mmetsp:Transcript_10491/g.10927  ORF Transcript_10491/g.10927 Transcript_10491/m.10927 type:complete len:117 (+) Transcript_10491:41-391(+)
MSNLSSKELDVLLHLELQKSLKYREDIEKELQEIGGMIDNYEIYKAKVSTSTDKRTFNDFLNSLQLSDGKNIREGKLPERRSSIKKQDKAVSQVPVITPHFMNTSTVLNKLKQFDL